MANVSVGALLLRLVVSLGVVVLLMAALARVARGRLGRTTRGSDPALQLQILSRQAIGKNASVLLVRAGDKGLLLGVTEHSISLIQETDIAPAVDTATATATATTTTTASRAVALTPPWSAMLQRARDVTVRRV
jgi:flagellar protein FliO/FliZ